MLSLFVKAQAARLFLQHRIGSFMREESGATAIEYGLIAAGIALAIITAVFSLGDELETFFNGVTSQLNAKQPG
jgi:pilus assembly protein Flp/PilA